jgi:hypothetical protein
MIKFASIRSAHIVFNSSNPIQSHPIQSSIDYFISSHRIVIIHEQKFLYTLV